MRPVAAVRLLMSKMLEAVLSLGRILRLLGPEERLDARLEGRLA